MVHSVRRATLLALTLSALATTPLFADHSWGGYHWSKGTGPVVLQLGDNVSGTWDSHLAASEADWDGSSVLELSVGAGQTRPKNCRPTAGRIEVCNAKYGANGWLGLAQIWLSGGHISQAVAKMNDSYQMYETEKRHVMCQEIGHGFGLGHTSEDGSSQNTCMDSYQNRSESDWGSTKTNAHDMQMLDTIYGHLDSSAKQLLPPPPAIGYIDFEGRGQWGVEVFRSENGRGSTFFLDFGHGHGVLTEVYWASPEHSVVDDDQSEQPSPWLTPRN